MTTMMTRFSATRAAVALLGAALALATACSEGGKASGPSTDTSATAVPPAPLPEPLPVPVPVPLPLTFPMPIEVAIADQRDAYTQNKLNLAEIDHFSILARDEITGDLGFATVSNVPAVGSLIADARAGVGVVMVGAQANTGWKKQALDLLEQGRSPSQVVEELAPPLATDAKERQLAVLGADGRSACHSGSDIEGGPARCYFVERPGCVAICSNIEKHSTKPLAMLDAFENSKGFPLPERLILALRAGWNEVPPESTPNADIQFRQQPKMASAASASLLVVRKASGYDHRSDVLLDLRVDLSRYPLPRLTEIYHAWCWAVLGPRLPAMLKELDPTSEAYALNQRWLRRARQRTKIGEE